MAPIGSWLLMQDLWLPFKFSSLIMLLAVPVALIMPETLAKETRMRLMDDADGSVETPSQQSPLVCHSSLPQQLFTLLTTLHLVGIIQTMHNILSTLYTKLRSTATAFHSILPPSSARELRLCLTVIFLFSFASRSGTIFVQYTSKVLEWPMARAGYLISINGLVMLGVMVLLAVLSQVLRRRGREHEGTTRRLLLLDMGIVRASAAVLGVGTLLMGLGRTPTALIAGYVVTGGGYGIYQALQSLLASFNTDRTHTGQVYASAALVELVARLTGGIVFARLFDIGMGLPSWGIGLPFLVASVCRRVHLSSFAIAAF